MVFNLIEDSLEKVWYRRYYEIEADTIEEAIKLIKSGEANSWDSEFLEYGDGEPEYREIMDNGKIIYKG